MNKSTYKKSNYTEKLKSILIVVLFISTVLLSYFYWNGFSLNGLKETVNSHLNSGTFVNQEAPAIGSFVHPRNVQVNFGDGTYNLYNESSPDLWQEFLPTYNYFSQQETLIVEEITKEQWLSAMDMKSIQYVFGYDLPFSFLESLGATNFGQGSSFSNISTIAYSIASENSLFILDNSRQKYYRIIGDTTLSELNDKIDSLKATATDQFYPIHMLLGTENHSLVPFNTQKSLPQLTSVKDTDFAPEGYKKNLAKEFFGESLDFIRRIDDDAGTRIYMYGYGQRMLSIYQEGDFEYQEIPTEGGISLSFGEALKLAVDFISTHGSWNTYDKNPLDMSLEYMSSKTKGKQTVYRFVLTQSYNNFIIYEQPSSNITIEVTGDQITYYKKDVRIYSEYSPALYGAPNAMAMDILSNNHQQIAQILIDENIINSIDEELDVFDTVVQNITMVDLGYYDISDETQNLLIPAWIISFSNVNFYFDLYTGVYLGYINEESR